MPDDPKADLARDIRFALRHKVTAGATRKVLRGLDEKAIEWLADDIAGHLLLCRWTRPPVEIGPSLMAGLPPRNEPWPRGESEPETGGQE